jgi:hypothetical protein
VLARNILYLQRQVLDNAVLPLQVLANKCPFGSLRSLSKAPSREMERLKAKVEPLFT